MKSLLLILALVGLFRASPLQAQSVDVLQIEQKLEDRLTQILKMVDPNGQAIVKAVLKNNVTALPGLGAQNIDVFIPGRFSQINLDDITQFNVTILSSLKSLPEWTTEQIKNASAFRNVQTKIVFSTVTKFRPDNPLTQYDSFLGWPQEFKDLRKDASWFALSFVFCLILSIVVLTILVSTSIRSSFRTHIIGLKAAFEEFGTGSSKNLSATFTSSDTDAVQNSATNSSSNGEGHFLLENYPKSSLLALFADCYWCHEDAYAAWVWSQITIEQRSVLLSELSFGEDYARFIYSLVPDFKNHHLHPAYSQNTGLIEISNADLKPIVIRSPDKWSLLSGLRQHGLNLNLIERIALEKAKTNHKKSEWPKLTNSAPRKLPEKWVSVNLRIEDEEFLLNTPESLNIEQKRNVPTLVWLALIDSESQKKILNQFSAEDLASVWIGPKTVLSQIEASLGEKKLNMLRGYVEKTIPNRQSQLGYQISHMALEHLATKTGLANRAEKSNAA